MQSIKTYDKSLSLDGKYVLLVDCHDSSRSTSEGSESKMGRLGGICFVGDEVRIGFRRLHCTLASLSRGCSLTCIPVC